jgi:hypothetical protein
MDVTTPRIRRRCSERARCRCMLAGAAARLEKDGGGVRGGVDVADGAARWALLARARQRVQQTEPAERVPAVGGHGVAYELATDGALEQLSHGRRGDVHTAGRGVWAGWVCERDVRA